MIRIGWVRGAYTNNFEAQNYKLPSSDFCIEGFSSYYPIHTVLPFALHRLPSFHDIGELPIIRSIPFGRNAIRYVGNRLWGDSQYLLGIQKYVHAFDIWHTADPHYGYSYQLAQLRNSGVIRCLIGTSWETIPHNNESVRQKKTRKQFVLKHTDAYICYTQKAADVLVSEGYPEQNIHIIQLGVDQKKFFPDLNRKHARSLLFVGRLVEEKGIMDLYSAYCMLPRNTYNLRIIGDGPLKQQLMERIRSDGLGHEVSIDVCSYEHIANEFRKADIFILPSVPTTTWEEQYGMVLMEAMSCGLAVIATRSGAIPEVVGKAAFLIDPESSHQLYDAIIGLEKENNLEKAKQKSLHRAETYFDSANVAQNIGTIYNKIWKRTQ